MRRALIIMLHALGCAHWLTMPPDSLLLQLPPELAANVWDKVGRSYHGEHRRSLWIASRKVQELFAPAVESITLTLDPEKPHNPDPLKGLHPTVRLRRLEVQSFDGLHCPPTMEIGVPMEAFEADTFTLFSKYAASSPILSTLQELRVQGYLITADDMKTLAPILQHVTSLEFEHCTFREGAVRELAACTKLQSLDLDMTTIDGVADLAVLRDLKSLSLSLHIEEDTGEWEDPDWEFLSSLGSCLTSLAITCNDRAEVLSIVVEHLHKLEKLSILGVAGLLKYNQAVALAGSPAGQHLRGLEFEETQVDWAALAALMAMPQLERLEGISIRRQVRKADTKPPVIIWPTGKPPMQLSMGAVELDQLAVMPLQHCSSFSTQFLRIAEQLSEEQRGKLMRTIHMQAAKCESFSCSIVQPSPRYSGIGLAGVGPDCPPLRWRGCIKVHFARIDAADVRSIAMHAGLDLLELYGCQLTADALPALNRGSFPKVKLTLDSCSWPSVPDLHQHLLQFAQSWVAGSDEYGQLTLEIESGVTRSSLRSALKEAFRGDSRVKVLPNYAHE